MNIAARVVIASAAAWMGGGLASAQSLTGNVGSADISDGDRGAEVRMGVDDTGAAAGRLHYDHALSDWYQLRVIAAFRKKEAESWGYKGVTLENWIQWATEGDGGEGFNGGMRLAYTLTDGASPDEIAARFTLTDKFAETWEWRTNIIAASEIGETAEDGASLESRFQLSRAVPISLAYSTNWRLGVELFSEYGNSENFLDLEDQAHQIGPVIKTKWKNGVYLQAATRAGLTDGSDDLMAKLFIGREF